MKRKWLLILVATLTLTATGKNFNDKDDLIQSLLESYSGLSLEQSQDSAV